MLVEIIYSRDALRQLKKLSPTVAKRIIIKITANANQENPLVRAKTLQGRLAGKYRYRIGDYRVIFKIDDSGKVRVLMVLAIKHRKDVYK